VPAAAAEEEESRRAAEEAVRPVQTISPDAATNRRPLRTGEDPSRVYLLKYSHAPQAWIDALENDAGLQQCRQELLNEQWHVIELLGGKFVRISDDPCTLDARVLGFENMDNPPKIFVRPVEVYRSLMDKLWKDTPPPNGTGTGGFRQELTNRHIFVSEDMLAHVKRIEADLPEIVPPEVPTEFQPMRPRQAKPVKQTIEIFDDRCELKVFSVSVSFPSDKTCVSFPPNTTGVSFHSDRTWTFPSE
jgi:hypothetical protein